MGVPFVEASKKVIGNNVRDVWLRSSSRSENRYRTRVSVPEKSIESGTSRVFVSVPSVFTRTRSILCILLAIRLTEVYAISDKSGDIKVEIKVPNEAKIGSSIELECEWQVYGPSGLYSVKWYKDDHEFFRYVPDDDPSIQTFSQPGISVDNRWNTEKSIRLKELETKSSGQYKCEVSTEAPSFATVYRTANLTVIAMPEKGPEITGLSPRYTIGDDLTANCTVWPSVPKADIRWLVNEKPIAAKKTIQYSTAEVRKKKERKQSGEKVETSTSATTPNALGLRVKLEPLHLEGVREKSAIAIKCIARVGSYLLETEKRVPINYAKKQRLSADDARSEAHGWHRVRPTERFSLLLICYFCSRLRTNDRMIEQNEQN